MTTTTAAEAKTQSAVVAACADSSCNRSDTAGSPVEYSTI